MTVVGGRARTTVLVDLQNRMWAHIGERRDESWGPEGVRLNAVAPAFTLTELTEGMGRDEESSAPFISRIALGRVAEPDDIAPAVLFLASTATR